jgi:hypothetical protein
MDVSWLLPSSPHRFHWPDLPVFSTGSERAPDGRSEEKLYTVPSRQLTAPELAQLGATNRAGGPAPK